MTTLERQIKFNNCLAKAIATKSVAKRSKKLLEMYDALNRDRVLVGLEPLVLLNLEKYRVCKKESVNHKSI